TFHSPYTIPTKTLVPASGMKTRSGLKMVTIFTMITKNLAPSRARRIFDVPTRARASVGSKATLYPALMNASVVVVGVENPFGSRCRNSRRHSRRAPGEADIGGAHACA